MRSLLIGLLASTACFALGFPTKYGNVPDRALGFMNDLREAAKNGEVNDYLASIGQDEAEDIIESLPYRLRRRVRLFLRRNLINGSGLPIHSSNNDLMTGSNFSGTVRQLVLDASITPAQKSFIEGLVTEAQAGAVPAYLAHLGREHVATLLSSLPPKLRGRVISFIRIHMV